MISQFDPLAPHVTGKAHNVHGLFFLARPRQALELEKKNVTCS
jgi:hypothetical protein